MVQKKQLTNTFIKNLKKTFPKKTIKKVVKLTKQLKNKTSKYANVVKRKTEATLLLDNDMSMEEELAEYLSYILELKEGTVKQIIGIFHDYSKEAKVA